MATTTPVPTPTGSPASPTGGLSTADVIAIWTAVGTWAAVLAAIGAGLVAYRAFRAQTEQVNLMRKQLDEQEKYNSTQLNLTQEQLKDQQEINRLESDALQLQARELVELSGERVLERDQRHRAQAERVHIVSKRIGTGDEDDDTFEILREFTLHNQSQFPIYRATIQLVRNLPNKPPKISRTFRVDILLAHDTKSVCGEDDEQFAGTEFVEILVHFRDAAGAFWTRHEDGRLVEQAEEY